MAYYNGNHRMVQRQPMMTCPNQAQNRQSSSGYGRNTASAQPCCNQNADTPHQDMPNAAEKKCMMQPRITPADGASLWPAHILQCKLRYLLAVAAASMALGNGGV